MLKTGNRKKAILLIGICCIIAAAALLGIFAIKKNSGAFPESYMITPTEGNYFDYQPGLECSAFSTAYLLRHYGKEADGMKNFETFPDKASFGVPPTGLVKFLQNNGYNAEYVCDATVDTLKEKVSKGAPVIVFIHLTENDPNVHYTHYLPLVGYDTEYFYFAESLEEFANCKDETGLSYNRKTKIDEFERLWKDIDGFWDYPYFDVSV